jgi:hypothetical protein
MNPVDWVYHWDNLKALDPDQLVSDLELTTEEILDAFHNKAEEFINENYG